QVVSGVGRLGASIQRLIGRLVGRLVGLYIVAHLALLPQRLSGPGAAHQGVITPGDGRWLLGPDHRNSWVRRQGTGMGGHTTGNRSSRSSDQRGSRALPGELGRG